MYLSTASTVHGLILAILLSAVLVLVLVLERQSTWTRQVLSQVLFHDFVKYLALSQELDFLSSLYGPLNR